MMNKKGVLGESVLMIYRLTLITIVAFFVLGVSGLIYNYEINVRDAEAKIMTREIVNCLLEKGLSEVSLFEEDYYDSLLEYCGISNSENRYYVFVNISSEDKTLNRVLYSGDSGARWVRKMSTEYSESYAFYEPGYSREFYGFNLDDKNIEMKVEVYVNADV